MKIRYLIGIGAAVARRPLPHHRNVRVRIRRFEMVTSTLPRTMTEAQAI
jgi:hypothetical protein